MEVSTVLHRGGMPNRLQYYIGGGSLGTPKSDYVICARPHMGKSGKNLSSKVDVKFFNIQNIGKLIIFAPNFATWLWILAYFHKLLVSEGFWKLQTLTKIDCLKKRLQIFSSDVTRFTLGHLQFSSVRARFRSRSLVSILLLMHGWGYKVQSRSRIWNKTTHNSMDSDKKKTNIVIE